MAGSGVTSGSTVGVGPLGVTSTVGRSGSGPDDSVLSPAEQAAATTATAQSIATTARGPIRGMRSL